MAKSIINMNKQELQNAGIWYVQGENRKREVTELAGSLGFKVELGLAVVSIETVPYGQVLARRKHHVRKYIPGS